MLASACSRVARATRGWNGNLQCVGWLCGELIDPCKWLNLTEMVEISQPDFRNFSAPERFQCIEEISKERLNREEEKSGVQNGRWL
jgi:hypothetical protein